MRALLFVAANQALLRHNLHGLQDGGVLRRLAGRDYAMDISNRGRPAAPKHGEDFQFRVSRPGRVFFIYDVHLRRHYYDVVRMSREKYHLTVAARIRGSGSWTASGSAALRPGTRGA